jgi:V8-like Glu-specific endopeptidase
MILSFKSTLLGAFFLSSSALAMDNIQSSRFDDTYQKVTNGKIEEPTIVLQTGVVQEAVLMRVGGKDGRVLLNDKRNYYPFSTQVLLAMGNSIGTATVIGAHTLLTAAHNIKENIQAFLFGEKLSITEITIFPGYADAKQGSEEQIKCDIAIIHVKEDISYVGQIVVDAQYCTTQFLASDEGVAELTGDSHDKKTNRKVTIVGYPVDKAKLNKNIPQLWGMMDGLIVPMELDFLFHEIDTEGGQSGSGVLVKIPGENDKAKNYAIVGVHAYGIAHAESANIDARLRDFNTAVRINKAKRDFILPLIK